MECSLVYRRQILTYKVVKINHKNKCISPFASGLFVDVGDNHSIIELSSNNFVYEEIDADNPNKEDSSHVRGPSDIFIKNYRDDFLRIYPSKRKTLNQCWLYVGPPSTTLDQL